MPLSIAAGVRGGSPLQPRNMWRFVGADLRVSTILNGIHLTVISFHKKETQFFEKTWLLRIYFSEHLYLA